MIFKENELNKLKSITDKLKKEGNTIVWTNGCFDILHPGHLETFKKAKKLGDILIVGLNGDNNPYWKTKPGRPINDEDFRSKILEGIKYIDFIYIFNDENPAKTVDILKPDIVLKGGDYYINKIDLEKFRNDKIISNNNEGSYPSPSFLHLSKSFSHPSSSFLHRSSSIKKFNEIVETKLVKKYNGIIDITDIYKYFLENDLVEIVSKIKGFMPEGLINVKNGGKVILVPTVQGYSTTNIVEKIIKTYCPK